MAIYHCSISNVSRAKGSNSCATLSYITGEKVKNERTGETHAYGRQERVLMTGTILPKNAPKEFKDSKVLFNAIENYEKNENARTAKKIEVALPREFDEPKQKEVVENYIKNNITTKGYAATYAIHTDKDNNNPHAHILIANRQINEKGEWSSKTTSEFVRDDKGNKIPIIDKETGEQKVDSRNRKKWKRQNVNANPLDKKETLQELRENWAKECNRHLERENQIDHRSYAERGIDREPTIHEGYASREMEKRGQTSERALINKEIREYNANKEVVKESSADGAKMQTVPDTTMDERKHAKLLLAREKLMNEYRATYTNAQNGEKLKELGQKINGCSAMIKEYEEQAKKRNKLEKTRENVNKYVEYIKRNKKEVNLEHVEREAKKVGKEMEKAQKKERVRSRADEGRGR